MTLAMAANGVGHRWTLSELLAYSRLRKSHGEYTVMPM